MTTQNTTITTGNPRFSKIFSDSSTDGVWSGNVLLDTISQQSLGILIPGATLSFVQPEYEAGGMAWRIQNAQTLAVSRYGFGALAGQNCYPTAQIAPVRVSPNDILTTFPVIKNSAVTPNTCNALAWISTSKGIELMQAGAVADNTATEMKTAVNDQTIGDAFFNSTLTKICVQLEDDAQLDRVEIVDNLGGIQMTLQGGYRGTTPSSRSNVFNLEAMGLNVPIGKGFKLNVVTVAGA
jgi:hypothetical protein